MLLGRSQEVPHGREEETHPMDRFFSQYSHQHLVFATGRDNTGASTWIQSACLSIPATDFLPIQNKFCQIIFMTHTWIQNLSVSPLCVDDVKLPSTCLQLTGIWQS